MLLVLPDTAAPDAAPHPQHHEIRHLDSILKLHNLRLIQWVPSERAEAGYTDPLNWIDLFKRIQNAGCRMDNRPLPAKAA